jgi:hypothetical protein
MSESPEHTHIDVDEAADFDEGLLDASASRRVSAAIASCATCAATHDAVVHAREALTGLGTETLPPAVADRLDAALAAEARSARVPGGAATVTALADRRRRWWLPVAAGVAAVGVLALVVPAVVRHSGDEAHRTAAAGAGQAAASAPVLAPAGPPESDSGNDYATAAAGKLSAALAGPRLPAGSDAGGNSVTVRGPAVGSSDTQSASAASSPSGSPAAVGSVGAADGTTRIKTTGGGQGASDPYAPLRDPATIEACAERLTGQQPAASPILVDYAFFAGQPAVALFFPSERAGLLDVYVVGPTCGAAADALLKFVRVPAR